MKFIRSNNEFGKFEKFGAEEFGEGEIEENVKFAEYRGWMWNNPEQSEAA